VSEKYWTRKIHSAAEAGSRRRRKWLFWRATCYCVLWAKSNI